MLTLQVAYGDLTKTLEISRISGTGNEGYFHISIDHRYQGVILWRGGKWVVLEQKPEFTTEDLDILVELLEQHLSKVNQKK